MRFKEILKQCVLVAVVFGLAGSAQAQIPVSPLSPGEFITASLKNYKTYLNSGPNVDGFPVGLPFINAPGLVSGTDDMEIAPGHLVREVVTDKVNDLLEEHGFLAAGLGVGFPGIEVQKLLNRRAHAEAQTTTPVMSAFSFSGAVVDAAAVHEHVVIDLARDHVASQSTGAASTGMGGLAVPTRLVKRLRNGEWKGFDHGSAGTVRHAQRVSPDHCPPPNHESWIETLNGLIPGSPRRHISCIRVTIVHHGMYDADERRHILSDPIMGVEHAMNPDLQLAHASAGGSSTGGGSAGAWTIMALLTVLGLSMLRYRRVTVRSEL